VEDLRLEIPSLDIDLGSLTDPMLAEARRVAPESPTGQKRILAIRSPLVYRLRHGDRRGATWVDPHEVLWLLAVEQRKEDSEDDAYDHFAALHRKELLLPTRDDDLRLRAESVAQILFDIRADAIALCTEAIFNLEQGLPFEQVRSLAGLIPGRVRALPGDVREIWLAISVRDVNGDYYPPPWRDLVFATVEDELKPDDWEWVTAFGGEALPWYEIGRIYLVS